MSKDLKVGDEVVTFVLHSTQKKLKVHGFVKEITKTFGNTNYIITEGIVEDFPSRTVKKLQ